MKPPPSDAPRPLPHVAAFLLGTAAVTLGLAAPAWAINRFEHTLASGDELAPAWTHARDVLLLAPMVGPLLLGVWLFVHVRRSLSRTRRWIRWTSLAGLLTVTVVAAFAVVVVNTFGQRSWLFGSNRPEVSVVSPNGARTAHLVETCFLGCTLFVYVEDRGSGGVMRRVGSVGGYDETRPLPAIDWAPDSATFTLRPLAPGTFSDETATLTFP